MYMFVISEAEMVRDDTTIQPLEATPEDLMVVHTKGYIDGLRVRPLYLIQ